MVRLAGLGQVAVERAHAIFAADLEPADVAVAEGGRVALSLTPSIVR